MQGFSSTRYIAIVKGARYVLLLGLVAIAVMIVLPMVQKSGTVINSKSHLEVDSVSLGIDQNVAENPRFYSVDKDNRPYNIEAKTGVQQGSGVVLLEEVFAQYHMEDNQLLSLVGDNAEMNSETNTVDLDGHVTIAMDDKYFLTAQKTKLLYKDSTAEGEGNVELSSKFGKVSSERFETKDAYDQIRFYGGRVKTIIYPERAKSE